MACIGGRARGKKREREEEEKEEPVVLSRDVLAHMAKFLSVEDLKAARSASRQLARSMRQQFFAQSRFVVTPDLLEDPHFRTLAPAIARARVGDQTTLDALVAMGAPLVDIIYAGPTWPQNLPLGLQRLAFVKLYTSGVVELPSTLTHLDLGEFFSARLGPLPATLTHLRLSDNYQRPLGPLPPNLEVLVVGRWFYSDLGPLPPRLVSLTLGWNYNHPIDPVPVTLREWNVPIEVQRGGARAYEAAWRQFVNQNK